MYIIVFSRMAYFYVGESTWIHNVEQMKNP
jgi:hypothetical protein